MTPQKIKRPKKVPSTTTRVTLQCGKLYITTTRFDDSLFEVFALLGKSGQCSMAQLINITTMTTMGLRHHVPAPDLFDKLIGTKCPTISIDEGVTYTSCGDAIGQVLAQEYELIREGYYHDSDVEFFKRVNAEKGNPKLSIPPIGGENNGQ